MPEAVLALDTGSPIVSVAVAARGELIAGRATRLERSSTQLLGLIDETLRASGLRPGDLSGLFALRGPGSFTGLRIALATALGMHQALGIPATAISTFQALAAAAARPGAPLLAVVDALRGEWSAQLFPTGDPDHPAREPQLIRSLDGAELARLGGRLEQGRLLTVIGFDLDPSKRAALEAAAEVDFLDAADGADGGGLAAPAARWFTGRAAAGLDAGWDSSLLSSPLYSRPPAVTPPKAARRSQAAV